MAITIEKRRRIFRKENFVIGGISGSLLIMGFDSLQNKLTLNNIVSIDIGPTLVGLSLYTVASVMSLFRPKKSKPVVYTTIEKFENEFHVLSQNNSYTET